MRALYLTHPQVRIDPNVPVPLWPLTDEGALRARAFVARGTVPIGASVFSSQETKALELANIIAAESDTAVVQDHLMGENDRSATGFLPPEMFESMADRFFAQPEVSAEGWERAVDAQARIVERVTAALIHAPTAFPVIFCGHGGVGTLLKCHLGNRPISRREDQSRFGNPGGGNGFVFDIETSRLLSEWMPMEATAEEWWL